MTMKFLAGKHNNAIRKAVSLVASPVALSSDYPVTNVGAGYPNKPFVFSYLMDDSTITADLNELLNGSFEDIFDAHSEPPYWNLYEGSGSTFSRDTTTYDTVLDPTSIASLKYYQNTGWSYADRMVFLIPGKTYTIKCAFKGDGTYGPILRLQNFDSRFYLNSSGTWQAATANVFTSTSSSWTQHTKTFTVEDSDLPFVPVNVRLEPSASAVTTTMYFDNIILFPTVTLCTVIGHNVPSGSTFQLRASTDNFVGSDVNVGSIPVTRDATFLEFSTGNYQYFRLKVGDFRYYHEYPWIGEWGLGAAQTLTTTYQPGPTTNDVMPQVRLAAPSGQIYSTKKSVAPSKNMSLFFRAGASTDPVEALTRLFKCSDWGDEPLIIIPDTSKTPVIHGRVGNIFSLNDKGISDGYYDYGVDIIGDSFPLPLFNSDSVLPVS